MNITSLPSHQAKTRCKGAVLPAGEGWKIGRINIVDDRIVVMVARHVDDRQPHGPLISIKPKALFRANLDVEARRKAQAVGRTGPLIERLHPPARKTGVVLRQETEEKIPSTGTQ